VAAVVRGRHGAGEQADPPQPLCRSGGSLGTRSARYLLIDSHRSIHLVLGPRGVFVIDSKQWTGQVHQSSDELVWHHQYRLDRTLASVCWQAETLGRVLGIPVAL
jgi:hypothetical protein